MVIYPYNKKVKSSSHTAQYKMHKYFARRPYNVFRSLIEHYTEPGDIVLDVFCGGGVTLFESLAINRKAIAMDLNPLATFITNMQVKQVNVEELSEFLYKFLSDIKKDYEFFYKNNEGTIEWVEWVYQVECPECKNTINLEEKNKLRNGIYQCSNKNCSSNKKDKKGVKRTDCKAIGRIPINIKIRSFDEETKTSYVRPLTEKEKFEIINRDYHQYIQPDMIMPDAIIPSNWDRAQEDKLISKGVYKFSDLFTERNYILNVIIFNKIMDLKKTTSNNNFIDCLYFVFSASLRYTNNMTRVTKNWENGNPTSMDKHAYWLPNQFIENNIFDKFNNRIAAILKGLTYTKKTISNEVFQAKNYNELLEDSHYMIMNRSSSNIPLPNNSINVVITDPPYGSNVQYGELSSYWNIWLKQYLGLDSYIDNKEEAVMNRKKNIEGFKDVDHYENILTQVFTECNRVLKDDGYLVFTFNNKNIRVWIALLKAVAKAGFYLPENGVIFQDFIESYKNTSHLRFFGNIKGDFIYSFKKGTPDLKIEKTIDNYTNYINKSIDNTILKLFSKKESYTTSELYQEIFTNLIKIIIEIIHSDLQTEDSRLVELEKYSNDYIDNYLRKKLLFKEQKWFLKR